MSQLRNLYRFEVTAARRAKTVVLFALGFASATLVVSLIGLSAGGVVAVQGFARTTMSLMQLVIWIVPLVGLLVGASVGAESLELEFQVSLPVRRSEILLARWVAWFAVLGGAMTIGLGLGGVLLSALAGSADGWRYLRLIAVSNLLLGAMLAIGLALGLAARTRIRAMGFGIVAWVVLVIGVDLIAIGALALLPKGQAGWGLTTLLMLDPVDSARALSIALLQADIVSGPTGAAIRKVLGGWGLWALIAALCGWVALPLYTAARRFGQLDL